MKRLMSLLQYLLVETGKWCRTSTTRDWKTISERVEHEGESFFTITLPNFGSDLQKALDRGKVDPSLFIGFKKRGELPVFLGGFLDLVFDRTSGLLLDVSDSQVLAIKSVRQICNLFGKLNEECSDERVYAAYRQYVQCESDIKANDARFPVADVFIERWGSPSTPVFGLDDSDELVELHFWRPTKFYQNESLALLEIALEFGLSCSRPECSV